MKYYVEVMGRKGHHLYLYSVFYLDLSKTRNQEDSFLPSVIIFFFIENCSPPHGFTFIFFFTFFQQRFAIITSINK